MSTKQTTRRGVMILGGAAVAAALGSWRSFAGPSRGTDAGDAASSKVFEVMHTDAEWHRLLSADQYAVLRDAGTERPYSSPLNNEHRVGTFHCAGCQLPAFSSATKFDSHTGWPSFWKPLPQAIADSDDHSFGVSRTAVSCRRCGGHLGHVFADGPQPTGLRYCMNGLALLFTPGTA